MGYLWAIVLLLGSLCGDRLEGILGEEKLWHKLSVSAVTAVLGAGLGALTYYGLGKNELDSVQRELNQTELSIMGRLGEAEIANEQINAIQMQLNLSQLISHSFQLLNSNISSNVSHQRINGGFSFEIVIENKGLFPVNCSLSNPRIENYEFNFESDIPTYEVDGESEAKWIVEGIGGRVQRGERIKFHIDVYCRTDQTVATPIIRTISEYYHPDSIERIQVSDYTHIIAFEAN